MIQATNKNYTVELIEQEKTTAGGIFIQTSDEAQLGRVLSAGPDISVPIDIGAQIVVNWQQTVPVKLNGTKVYVVPSDFVLGVVNGS